MQQETLERLILLFLERLKSVTRVNLHSKSYSKTETGWNATGEGEVFVEKVDDTTLIFHEKGILQNRSFSNAFRWILAKESGIISLEHMHLGKNTPVLLCHFIPTKNNLLTSVKPHLCKEDAYSAQVILDPHRICLCWSVVGPRKDEEVEHRYF